MHGSRVFERGQRGAIMKQDGSSNFKLSSRGVMIAVVSAAFSSPLMANTGKVDFTIGNVILVNADGRSQPLKKGTEVMSGDKINSGVDGHAQIRFSDGGYISLQPNSEFEIKEYHYNGKADGTESALFGLFKGAMRTVTGLVGRVNRNKYQVSTPTATIGIRGTGGLIKIGTDGSTLVTGTSGIWTLSNAGGTLEIPAGSSGFAGRPNVPPRQTSAQPIIPPTPIPTVPAQFVAGDQRNDNGNPATVGASTVLLSGPGYAVAPITTGAPSVANPSNAVFDSSGRLTQFDQGGTVFTFTGSFGTETHTDGVLAWGRWIGTVTAGGSPIGTFTANEGLHYVVGLPTPTASMPTTGTFTYTGTAATATSPTFGNGTTAPGTLVSASLTANFSASSITANVVANAGGFTYTGSVTGPISGVTFSGAGGAASASPLGGCSGGCTLGVGGFFSGSGATRAGMTYQFGNATPTGGTTTLSGAVALTR
jgi:hypothetical protein